MINRLPELLFKDFWLKLFSLALAILIWFTIFQAIQQQGSPVNNLTENLKERTFYNLPVTKVSSSSDVSGCKISPEEVRVTVQGETKQVVSLQDQEIKVRVDLSGLTPHSDPRRPIEVAMPAGITFISVEPSEIQVVTLPKDASSAK